MTRLILVRHGETDWNVEGRYQGHSDVPLNARGRAQAARLAEALRGSDIRAIYSSDLARARETAEALAHATRLAVQHDPRLREIDQGDWEGMLFLEIHLSDFARAGRPAVLGGVLGVLLPVGLGAAVVLPFGIELSQNLNALSLVWTPWPGQPSRPSARWTSRTRASCSPCR